MNTAATAGVGGLTEEQAARYAAYTRLQANAVAFNESVPIPELVVVGGQSDGKSSLLEGFLGFRFNVREVEMGTRRPLIVQMQHDPTALEPRCRLQHEDSGEYGPPIAPETAVADAIAERTAAHLRGLGGAAVSAKPIVMRAEYAFCPNLTLIDTPGLILKAPSGEADSTPDEILAMVRELAAPQHRMILFLQQSSVEWAASLWLRVVQELDPLMERTVMVVSKFDNRLKEFDERWEVDKYLSATGYLPANARPFFVALPKERGITSSSEWRRQMADVDAAVLRQLRTGVKGGFDEERHGARIGFANLRRFLEDELARRYREAAPATLALLQERCEAMAGELAAVDGRLRACSDVAAMRRAGMRHAARVAGLLQDLLAGSCDPDPSAHGLTTEQERAAANVPWPGCASAAGGGGDVVPPNAGLRLFGGAAFERCLNEFQVAAHALAFPSAAVARDRVANVLLAYKARNHRGGAARAAEDIARQTARELLGPLLDAACGRLAYVLRRSLDIAAAKALRCGGGHGGGNGGSHGGGHGGAPDALQPYVSFHAELRKAHMAFVSRLEASARRLLQHHLDAATSEFALAAMAALPDAHFFAQPAPVMAVAATQQQQQQQQLEGAADDGGSNRENSPPAADDEHAGTTAATAQQQQQPLQPHRTPHRTHIQMTVPETPSPNTLAAAAGAGAGGGVAGVVGVPGGRNPARGPGRHVSDTTPSKGRAAKSQRVNAAAAADIALPTTVCGFVGAAPILGGGGGGCGALYEGRGTYGDVVGHAERLFGRIRHAVVGSAAPTALKAAFLDALPDIGTDAALELFARPDDAYMALFAGGGALQALQAKRDALARRCESLLTCKNEFAELAREL